MEMHEISRERASIFERERASILDLRFVRGGGLEKLIFKAKYIMLK